MTKRQKWFAGAIASALVLVSIVTDSPGILIRVGLLFCLTWAALRAFLFVRNLLSPLRDRFKPEINAVNSHLDSTLRKSGLGAVADLGRSIDRGINKAADEAQSNIDARNK